MARLIYAATYDGVHCPFLQFGEMVKGHLDRTCRTPTDLTKYKYVLQEFSDCFSWLLKVVCNEDFEEGKAYFKQLLCDTFAEIAMYYTPTLAVGALY